MWRPRENFSKQSIARAIHGVLGSQWRTSRQLIASAGLSVGGLHFRPPQVLLHVDIRAPSRAR